MALSTIDLGGQAFQVHADALGRDGLAAALALVGREHDARVAVDDTVAERIGTEAGEDDRVDGADTRAGQEGDSGLGNWGAVSSVRNRWPASS